VKTYYVGHAVRIAFDAPEWTRFVFDLDRTKFKVRHPDGRLDEYSGRLSVDYELTESDMGVWNWWGRTAGEGFSYTTSGRREQFLSSSGKFQVVEDDSVAAYTARSP
jgi:hypothetical protein